jgi:hypothetical protein
VTITVRATGLSICHKGSGGFVRNTIPDVCRTPTVPVPHVIISFSRDLVKGSRTVVADGGHSIAIRGSEFATCTGDEPGVGKGVVSGTNKGKSRWLTWSPTVYVEGRNVCRLTDKMTMNTGNAASLNGLTQADVAADPELQVLCVIFCQCLDAPAVGARGQRLYQVCASTVITSGDRALNWQSTAKAEISYDMTQSPPAPLMHRVNGRDTTEPSRNWFGRAQQIPGYRPGTGMVRRPDVVLVRDPTLPPTQGNIRRIVEMKFPGDQWSADQERDYQRIAGSAPVDEMNEDSCGCDERRRQRQPQEQPSTGIDWLTIGLAALAIVLILSPIPGDEAAAGAAAAARMGIRFAF